MGSLGFTSLYLYEIMNSFTKLSLKLQKQNGVINFISNGVHSLQSCLQASNESHCTMMNFTLD